MPSEYEKSSHYPGPEPEVWVWAAAGGMMAMLSLFCWWIW